MSRRAVFLDRDGTVVYNRHYASHPDELELLPGAAEGLRTLAERGYALVVVTNQSGVGRGYFTADDLEHQHERLRALLRAEGVELDGIYACVHAPDAGCECRKPLPGLLLRAASDLDLDLSGSWMVGDEERDVLAGRAAGVRTVELGDACPDLVTASAHIAGATG